MDSAGGKVKVGRLGFTVGLPHSCGIISFHYHSFVPCGARRPCVLYHSSVQIGWGLVKFCGTDFREVAIVGLTLGKSPLWD